jgi:segregation and condensation protein B
MADHDDHELEDSLADEEILSLDSLGEAFARAMDSSDLSDDGSDSEQLADDQEEQPLDDSGEFEPDAIEPVAEVVVDPRSILEAILFVDNGQNQSLLPARAAELMRGVEPGEILDWIAELNQSYRANRRPYEIRSEGAGYRLVLREEFAAVRERFYGKVREARLSQAAIDILAIVAYRQPIDSDEVHRLRDRPCGPILNQLVRRKLIRIERPESNPKKPLYHTTDRFLELFRLENINDLPQVDSS